MVFEWTLKVHRKPEYYIIYKNGTNKNVSTDSLKASYLEENRFTADFPPLHLNDMSLRSTTSSLIINNHDETLPVSQTLIKATRSERRVMFPEYLNDYRV